MAKAGKQEITLTATSTTDPTITDSATTTVTVEEVPGIKLTAPSDQKADPGEKITLKFTIRNTGNTFDRLQVSAKSRRGYEIAISRGEIELPPGHDKSISVSMTIPEEASAERDWVIVTVTSLIYPQVSEKATVVVTILPPYPQAIGTTLFLEVPSEFSQATSGTLPDGDFTLTDKLDGNVAFGKEYENSLTLKLSVANLVNLDTVLFDLESPSTRFALGDVSLNLGELNSAGGRGALIGLFKEEPLLGIEAVGVRSEDISYAGARLYLEHSAMIFTSWNSSLELGEEPTIVTNLVFDAFLSPQTPEFTFDNSFEAAVSHSAQDGWGKALYLNPEFNFDHLEFDVELIRSTTNFAGDREDEEGFEIDHRIETEHLDLHSVYEFSHDNVDQLVDNPIIYTSSWDTTAQFSPAETLPTLGMRFDWEKREDKNVPPELDEKSIIITLRLAQTLDFFSYTLFGRYNRSTDLIADTDFSTLRTGFDMGVNLEDFTSLIRISKTLQQDLKADEIVDEYIQVSSRFRFIKPCCSISLNIDQLEEVTTISIDSEFTKDNLTLGLGLSSDMIPEKSNPEITVTFGYDFDLPIPFIFTKGQIEGYVFIDENGNGEKDMEEEGISHLILSLDRTQARTNGEDKGFYRFPPLQPGEYELGIEDLPTEYAPTISLPVPVELGVGEVKQVDISVIKVASIRGRVFNDQNQDGKLSEGEPGLGGVRLILSGPESAELYSASDGSFSFANLPPGDYKVTVDEGSLPERFVLTTPAAISVSLKPEDTKTVNFGAYKKPKEVVFSPTADFEFEPKRPIVDEEVTFDGSSSFDPDGEIVKYKWDFDGDGVTDKEGKIVKYVFEKQGEYSVTLTVTDNDGETDQVTKKVLVVEG